MLSFFKEYKVFAIVFGIISVIIMCLIYNTLNVYQPLPIFTPSNVDPVLVDSTIQHKKTNMAEIQKAILDDDDVMLLSHSVTPEIDSVEQLKRYAIKKGVNDKKWNLVTGDKKDIYALARKSYLAVKSQGDGGPFDMIHTENFLLIDKKKQIRGFYDGTQKAEIERLLDDIAILKEQYER